MKARHKRFTLDELEAVDVGTSHAAEIPTPVKQTIWRLTYEIRYLSERLEENEKRRRAIVELCGMDPDAFEGGI